MTRNGHKSQTCLPGQLAARRKCRLPTSRGAEDRERREKSLDLASDSSCLGIGREGWLNTGRVVTNDTAWGPMGGRGGGFGGMLLPTEIRSRKWHETWQGG